MTKRIVVAEVLDDGSITVLPTQAVELIKFPLGTGFYGEVKVANAEIIDAQTGDLRVLKTNIFDPRKETFDDFAERQKNKEDVPVVRFMIQQRCPLTGNWTDSGIAVEQYREDGETKARTVFVAAYPTTRVSSEQTDQAEPECHIEALRKEVDALKRQVNTLTSKLRVEAVTNLAHVLRDIDRRGMA